jgi:eukaryotic-like serine/threonine-protein kinase
MAGSPGAIEDDLAERMLGLEVPSESGEAVYRILTKVGEGAMSVAFYALRVAADGECPVVVKVVRPWLVRQWGQTAKLLIQKEAIALGRLNERVPPTPFVVRFIDVGTLHLPAGNATEALPYIVVEYVHGGAIGTTLTERVRQSLRATGMAFGPTRAGRVVEALTSGMTAVHDVGVVHRDLKPDNVLCCGTGAEEIFKIADFGVARPAGVAATFGGFLVGTMGYAAPELATHDSRAIGPWSDVFSLAAIFYFVLTGEDYFDVRTPADAIVAAVDASRRSIRDSPGLSPVLRAHEEARRAIDYALACSSAAKTDARPHRADALATMIVPWLRAAAPASPARRRTPIPLTSLDQDEMTRLVKWSWTTLRRPGTLGKVIRNVAWDADGRCMAATSEGLAFWNGSTWSEVDHTGLPNPSAIRFVRRAGPGRWLVGGDEATFATYTEGGVRDVRRFQGWDVRFDLFSGDIDDLAVLVGAEPGGPTSLCALSSRRWLKPLSVPDIASVTSLTRIEDARWLVAGRGMDGKGYAGIYAPLDWEIARIDAGRARAFLSTAGQHEHGIGLATGTGGAIVWTRDGATIGEIIEGGPDLSAAAVDAAGRGWAASAGRIWLHCLAQAGPDGLSRGRWDTIWHDPTSEVPIVALFTDPGLVIAMTADGGIIEGRATDKSVSTHPPPP